MDIQALRNFAFLADHGHVGRAAQALNLSQPALSKQIHRLEREVGMRLFDRGPKGVVITAAGAVWLSDVRSVLHHFDAMLLAGRRASAGDTGRLRIGFGYHTMDIVPRLLVKLRRASPGAAITLRDLSTAEQTLALRSGNLDVGFLRLPLERDLATTFQVMPVATDRIALVVPRLASYAAVRAVPDLDGLPIVAISPDRSPGFHRHMLALCAQHGFSPHIVQSVTEFGTAMALVRAGMGAAFVPASSLGAQIDGVRTVQLAQRAASWSVGVAWKRKDSNPLLGRFLELIRREVRGVIG